MSWPCSIGFAPLDAPFGFRPMRVAFIFFLECIEFDRNTPTFPTPSASWRHLWVLARSFSLGTSRRYYRRLFCLGGLFHANRDPFPRMMKLRPKNPLLLAVIEEAEVPSMASIASFGHDCLSPTHSAFESLSNYKPHRPSSDRSKANQLATAQLYQFMLFHSVRGSTNRATRKLAIGRRPNVLSRCRSPDSERPPRWRRSGPPKT